MKVMLFCSSGLSGFLVLMVAVGLGCGARTETPDGGGGGDARGAGPLLPWHEGNVWNYRVNDTGVVTMKSNVIEPMELIGGDGPHSTEMAFKVVTKKRVIDQMMDQTISYQMPVDDKVLRYRELSFSASSGLEELDEHWDPHKLHIDGTVEHTTAGVKWLESYQETKLPAGGTATTADSRDLWSVLSESETVTVPAGTFQAVKFQKVGGSSTKTYWYVYGIGKVKEAGGQLEELVSYDLKN